MVWAGGRSCTGSSWVSPASQVSRDAGQLLSSALLAQTLSPISSSLLNPCQINTPSQTPKCCSTSVPRQEGFGGASAGRAARGSAWKRGMWAAPGACQHGLGVLGCPWSHSAEPWPHGQGTPQRGCWAGVSAAGTAGPVAPSHKEAH